MTQRFPEEIDAILSATTVGRLRRVVFRIFRNMGFRRIAYIHSVLGQPESFFVDQIGFPSSIASGYLKPQQQLDDPFPLITRQYAFPIVWSSVENIRNLSKRHQKYISRMRSAGIGDGVSVSVSGPNGRDGYFALGYGRYGVMMSDRELSQLQLVCQAAHSALCDLTRKSAHHCASLTNREAQVLVWIARGKTNGVVADILGISKHTVDTLSKRIFRKLGVNDRLSAVIVGARSGALPHNASGSV